MNQLPDIPRGVSLFNGELRGLLNDMVRAINDLQGSAGSGSGSAGGRSIPGAGMIPRLHFWAKITGYSEEASGRRWYTWVEMVNESTLGYTGWAEVTGGRNSTDQAKARRFCEILGKGGPAVPTGAIVIMQTVHVRDGVSGLAEWWFDDRSDNFAVRVYAEDTDDGETTCSSGTTSSITYTVKDLYNDITLGTGLLPQNNRVDEMAYELAADGTVATAYVNSSGAVQLLDVPGEKAAGVSSVSDTYVPSIGANPSSWCSLVDSIGTKYLRFKVVPWQFRDGLLGKVDCPDETFDVELTGYGGGAGSGCTVSFGSIEGTDDTTRTVTSCAWKLEFTQPSPSSSIIPVDAVATLDAANTTVEVALSCDLSDAQAWIEGLFTAADIKVKVSANDAAAGYLFEQLEDDNQWIVITEENDGAAETAKIAHGSPANPGGAVTTLGSAAEGTETAASDTWTSGGANGVTVWIVSRIVYNDAGDKILYQMMRSMTYDKLGHLYAVSAETRVSVDAAEACS